MLNKKKKVGPVLPLQFSTHIATMVAATTKTSLFHHIKFVSNQAMLDDLKEPNTIGKFILRKHEVSKEQDRWWETYKDTVHSALNNQCSIVTSYMMAKFFGKKKPDVRKQ